jgi:hypothetical protein
VTCQANVIRHVATVDSKWEDQKVDLWFDRPLKSMKGQVVADFIVGHSIVQNNDESYNLVSIRPWRLFFDGSACREG